MYLSSISFQILTHSFFFVFSECSPLRTGFQGSRVLSVVVIAVYVNRHYWKYAIFSHGNPGIITTPFVVYIVEKEKMDAHCVFSNTRYQRRNTNRVEVGRERMGVIWEKCAHTDTASVRLLWLPAVQYTVCHGGSFVFKALLQCILVFLRYLISLRVISWQCWLATLYTKYFFWRITYFLFEPLNTQVDLIIKW